MIQVGDYGTTNVIEVIDLGMSIISGLKGAQADGKIDMNDISFLIPAFMALSPALQDINQVWLEVKDIQGAELDGIKNHIITKWSAIPGISTKWIRFVEAAFKIAEGVILGLDAYDDLREDSVEA